MKKLLVVLLLIINYIGPTYGQSFDAITYICGRVDSIYPYNYSDARSVFEESENVFSWAKFTFYNFPGGSEDFQVLHEWYSADDPSTPIWQFEDTYSCCGLLVSTSMKNDLPPGDYFVTISVKFISAPGYVVCCSPLSFTIKSKVSARIYNMDFENGDWNPNQTFFIKEINRQNYQNAANRVRIAADGSSATLVQIHRIGNDAYRLYPQADPDGVQVEQYGKFDLIGWTDSIMQFKYTHPTKATPASVKMMIVNENTGTAELYYYAEFVRPPVLLLHGLGSSAEAMQPLKQYLSATGYTNFSSTYVGSYTYPGKAPFIVSYPYVHSFILEQISKARSIDKVSAGRADVVGYSMGGLLARMYLQNSGYQSDINKLITINTPHSGSELANNPAAGLVAYLTNNPAINHLGTGCNSIRNLLNGPSVLNAHVVPSHTLFSIADVDCPGTSSHGGWSGIILSMICGGLPVFCGSQNLIDCIFHGANDGVVSELSQQGGLIAAGTLTGSSISHTEAVSSASTQIECNYLLGLEKSSWQFSQTGFNPAIINANPESETRNSLSIHFDHPMQGDSLYKHQNLIIQVTGSPEISNSMLVIYQEDKDSLITLVKNSGSFISNYNVPSDLTGTVRLGVIGSDGNGGFVMDTLSMSASQLVLESQEPETETQNFVLWPNPAKDFIQIVPVQAVSRPLTLDIVGMTGQVLGNYTFKDASADIIISTETFPAGIYFARINLESQNFTLRFVK